MSTTERKLRLLERDVLTLACLWYYWRKRAKRESGKPNYERWAKKLDTAICKLSNAYTGEKP